MKIKQYLAELASKASLTRMTRFGCNLALMPYLRSVNYHSTPKETRKNFRKHTCFYKKNYEDIDEKRLEKFFEGKLKMSRPGIIIGFDDGYADNYEMSANELEEAGLTGWFYIIVEMVGRKDKMGRPYMTWEQIRKLHRSGHVIGSHTRSHVRLGKLSHKDLENQIVESKKIIEDHLSAEVTSFCFPFGDNNSYGEDAIGIAMRTYKYIFNSCPGHVRNNEDKYNIGRNHVESDWSVSAVDFVTSGLFDIKYRGRNRRYRLLMKGK